MFQRCKPGMNRWRHSCRRHRMLWLYAPNGDVVTFMRNSVRIRRSQQFGFLRTFSISDDKMRKVTASQQSVKKTNTTPRTAGGTA